ncbi:MAG: alpha/beta hydrolase [Mycobacteriaceae bacterium]|nr:alpha/beta hydrolase [Mycobacteriaceae bacterium]
MVTVDRRSATGSVGGRVLSLAAFAGLRSLGALSRVSPSDRVGASVARAALDAACWLMPRTSLPHQTVQVAGPRGQTVGEWVGERPRPGQPLILYIHGSGYVGCSVATHRGLVSELARRLRRPAFSLEYRLAPRHRFPQAHDDVLNGYLWLLDQGYAPADIVVIGDSAGGHLALGLCMQLREREVAQPRAVIGFSPLVDSTWRTARTREPSVRDSFMTADSALKLTGLYTGYDQFDDYRLDVLGGVGPDLPPMLLQAGGNEILAADAEAFAAAQRAAGGWCELETWPGMFHVFQMASALVPEARDALRGVERFVAEVETPHRRSA